MAHLREGEPYMQALGFDTVDEIGGPRGTCATDSDYSDYPLYDLDRDPDEQHNLIGAPRARTLERSIRDALLVRLAASAYVIDSVNL